MVYSTYLVTGASGLLGSQIVKKLLDAGHTVRGSARGEKVSNLAKVFANYDKFTVVDVPDLATSDLSVAFKDVEVLIHVAAFLPSFRGEIEVVEKFATEGTERIMDSARLAGVKTIIVTGSQVTYNISGPFGPRDWQAVTFDDARNTTEAQHFVVYIAQKIISEQTMLNWAEKHPDTRVVIIDPTYIFGPFVPNYKHIVNHPKLYVLESSNYFVHFLLRPENKVFVVYHGWMDVRDIATLTSTPIVVLSWVLLKVMTGKRLLPISRKSVPELADRLCSTEKAPVFPMQVTDLDRNEKYLGVKKGSYTSFQKSIVDTVDSIHGR
ncbi:NAD(P)-binding protein [Gymnopus androsaceus JB14]|uniref:NAD(P)-binding protein n=1 Tax=Gymnopus androsaceus JB14 TaxID=1447944 RepID=A0A6A4HGL0_9AGAR|nr:NAD(P)-binding protein [Gymnopus androsaceus JB14]